MGKQTAQFLNPDGRSAPRGLAAGLAHYGSVAEFRAAAPLPKDTQEMIDDAVVRVGRQRLVIADDLLAEGLVKPMPNWISVPSLYWERIGEAGHAQRTMVPKARGERQIMDRGGSTLPIYCTWDDFSFSVRELAAAQRVGQPLDTVHVEQATRNVNEGIEDAVINGAGLNVGGFTTPGMLNTTNTQAYVDTEAWTHANHSGEDILTDVLNMIGVARADKFYGPYNLYIPTTYGNKLNQDFKANSDKTIRQRLEEIVAGGRPLRIREADQLPTDRTLLVQMTSDVCDMIVGQTPASVSWSDPPGWETYFVILACLVFRLKANAEGNYGVVAGNTS